MRVQRKLKELTPDELIALGVEAPDRIALDGPAREELIGCYVLTRGASAAWEAINSQIVSPFGALFWIHGPRGAGKTHFLTYAMALAERAGAIVADSGRHLALKLDLDGGLAPAAIDRKILELIAHELAGDNRGAALWRRMAGAEALAIAIDSARRQGVRGITLAIDFGGDDAGPAHGTLAALAELAKSSRALRLIAIAAGRGEPPLAARGFEVAPGPSEEMRVAIGRARRLEDAGARAAETLYRKANLGVFAPSDLYPFHPAAAELIAALRDPAHGVAGLARMARAALEAWMERRDALRPIAPAELMALPAIERAARERLGEAGRAAVQIAESAAGGLGRDDRTLRMAVKTLVANHLAADGAALEINELRSRLPREFNADERGAENMTLAESMAALASRSRGAIVYDAARRAASFDPRGAGAPEVAAFNAALPLIRRFDSTLGEARDKSELESRVIRLEEAIASALEGAHRNRDLLAAAMRGANARMSDDHRAAFERFIELAESGAAGIVAAGADDVRRQGALGAIAAYEKLALIASAAPRLRMMRQYLEATRMHAGLGDDPSRDRALALLETECQLLAIAVNPAVLAGAGRSLDTLEARFQKFKWTYVQHYRVAHEQWRIEMDRLAPLLDDVRRRLEALRRLNAIASLGPAEGAALAALLAPLEERVRRCDGAEQLAPETAPCCLRCDFALGANSPREELADLFDRLGRALQSKLAALSRDAIYRLIRAHDHNHRLEGFLKIIQAAQTDALVRVLDEKLARYLARLIDDAAGEGDFEAASEGGPPRRVMRALPSTPPRDSKLSGANRPAKTPRGHHRQ